MAIILGIDPGSRITGYGVIRLQGRQAHYVASGCIVTKETLFTDRLAEISQGIAEVVRRYSPEEAAIEQIFVKRNVATALKLGHARGVAIAAIAACAIPVAEYSTRKIKQTVVGYGGADKTQVQHMVKCLLHLTGEIASDAADALAVALCHVQNQLFLR